MTASVFLSGLLSRPGPSLFSLALVCGPSPTHFFSTNTLLDSFLTRPEEGDVLVPVTTHSSSSEEMTVRRLDSSSFEEARRTLEVLVGDGFHFIWGEETLRKYPLPATGGEWFVGDRIGDEALSFFHPRTQRFNRVSLFSDGGFSVTLGWHSPQVRISQEVAVNAKGGFLPGGYQFEFNGTAVEGFKTLMKVPQKTGAETALELAALIYASGQYSPEETGCSLKVIGPKGRWRDLPRNEGTWELPEDRNPQQPLIVGTRRCLARRDDSRVKVPVADTYWEPKEGLSGHLMVRLHNLPEQRLPLHPTLKNLLWDGALSLLYGWGG